MLPLGTLIWLLVVAFVCNDGEELLTMERWIRQNRDRYRRVPEALVINLQKPITAQFAVAVSVVGAVVLAAAWVGARSFAETGRLHGLFVAVLVVMFLDGVKHVLVSLWLRGYTSGVFSAALAEVPCSAYAFCRFLSAGAVTPGEILRYGLMGVALVFPLLGLGFALGRWLVPARKGRTA